MKKRLITPGELPAPAAAPEVPRENDAPLKHEMLAVYHRLAQTNRSEHGQIQEIGRRMGLKADKLELWGARTLAAISIKGSATASEVVQAFKLGEASQLLKRATLTAEQMTHLRQLASEVKPNDARAAQRVRQAEQQGEQQVNQPRLTSQRQPVQQPQQGPTASRSVGGGALVQPWSEDRIREAVDKLAKDNNVTAPSRLRVMEDILVNPNRSVLERAEALGFAKGTVEVACNSIRSSFGMDSSDLGEQLAKRIGMTSAELVARYQVPNEPGLAQRVISAIPESYREVVASTLLSYNAGGNRLNNAFKTLETMFTEDPNPKFVGSAADVMVLQPFRDKFGSDSLTMLRNMGFKNEQILRMNPVGDELANRLDPKLGTYSGAELQSRKDRGLPTTREEAALFLLTARTAPTPSKPTGMSVSYRNWIALALTSDNPSFMPSDLQQAYEKIKPSVADFASSSDLSHLFRAVEFRYGLSIERSPATFQLGREYRLQLNTLMLQLFGLGKRSMSTGKIESISTDFQPSMSPSSSNKPESGVRRGKPESSGADKTTWKELWPLLRPDAGGN